MTGSIVVDGPQIIRGLMKAVSRTRPDPERERLNVPVRRQDGLPRLDSRGLRLGARPSQICLGASYHGFQGEEGVGDLAMRSAGLRCIERLQGAQMQQRAAADRPDWRGAEYLASGAPWSAR